MRDGDYSQYLKQFLARIGVSAEVHQDAEQGVIVRMAAATFQQRRSTLDPWFTVVRRDDDYCLLRERLRGSDTPLR